MKIGEKIKEVIDWSPYTQKDVAEVLDVSQTMVSNYISGANPISLDKLERLAEFMGVSIWVFLNGEPLPVTTLDITTQEAELIAEYRRLDGEEQKALNQFLKSIKR